METLSDNDFLYTDTSRPECGKSSFRAEMEEVFRSFTEVKVSIQQCKNTPLQVKVLKILRKYCSKST